MFDEYFKHLHRSAIVLSPQQPFFDWLLSHDSEMIIDDDVKAGEVYLLPKRESKTQMENWLKKNFEELFSEQLHNWYIDETMWPQKRTFKLFGEWFSYSLYTLVCDTQEGFIEKS